MALITSHILNGVDGTHAVGVPAVLKSCSTDEVLMEAVTDEGGRLEMQISPKVLDDSSDYELALSLADYWAGKADTRDDVIGEIVLRFSMAEVEGKYHMPIIVSPHSYSTWKSSL